MSRKVLPICVVAVVVLMALVLAGSVPSSAAITVRASVHWFGDQANAGSDEPEISADGDRVVFTSSASNLVDDDADGFDDVFSHDFPTTVTWRVSESVIGDSPNAASRRPAISADGKVVVWESGASNIVDGDTNGKTDIFLFDGYSGITERVSVNYLGVQGNGNSTSPSVSADGRFVAFISLADNLYPGGTSGRRHIYVHDRATRATSRVSESAAGVQGNADSGIYGVSISGDGRYVAFESYATNLVADDTNMASDVYVKDRQTGAVERVSVNSSGTQGNNHSQMPSISADGVRVAFVSSATNLYSGGDTNGVEDVFVRDRNTSTTYRVSFGDYGQADGPSGGSYPSISPDGRYVAFDSSATNLVQNDTNGVQDVFVHDMQTGLTERASVTSGGMQANDTSAFPSISTDGRFVAFKSHATNLVADDTNSVADIFVRNMDSVNPTVTIDRAAGQADPTNSSPINFTVVFSEPVADFATGDVTLSGTAGATTAIVTGSGTTYNVAVSGMTAVGTVIATIPIDVAHDAANNNNFPSTSTDNTVQYRAYPVNTSLTPSGGTLPSGTPFTIQCTYSDANGWTDLKKLYLLVNDSLGQANAALFMFDIATTKVFLKNDANNSWGVGYVPGVNVTLENSQCSLLVKDCSAVLGGNDVTVNWQITLKSPFSTKLLNSYMYVQDMGGLSDGWELMGRYYNVKPQAVSISPESGSLPINTKTTLTSVYRDPNGYRDLRKCYLLVNDSLAQTNAVFLWYDKATNQVYLKNDANTSWGTGYTPGTNVTLQNSQCTVYVASTTVLRHDADLVVKWSIKLDPSMNDKNLYSYMYVTDSGGLTDGWKKVGTHFTPAPPICVSVHPSTGGVPTGVPTVFTTQYSDANGSADISQCYFQMGQTGSLANAVCVLYDTKQNKVFLRNNANTSWGTGQTPGTVVTLENSQCVVHVKDVTVIPGGASSLIIDWKITLKPVLAGKLLGQRMYCRDNEWLNSTWKLKGYVRGQ